jgi:adenosylmethionine-8-amino-7-oxononanoate aminotransferase
MEFPACAIACIDDLERTIDREGPDTVAAFMAEPVVGATLGAVPAVEGYWQRAREICDRHGVLLIADEVMTGFGRTGEMFASASAGVAPDLLCLAKGLTNGMVPLAATLASAELYATFASFARPDRGRFLPHGHSMTANPIGCAVALRSLELARERGVPARLAAIGARIEAALAPLAKDPRVRDLRRSGGIVAFDLVAGDAATGGGYVTPLAPKLRARAVELGVLLRPLGNVVYALPPAATSDAECDAIAAAMRALVAVA